MLSKLVCTSSSRGQVGWRQTGGIASLHWVQMALTVWAGTAIACMGGLWFLELPCSVPVIKGPLLWPHLSAEGLIHRAQQWAPTWAGFHQQCLAWPGDLWYFGWQTCCLCPVWYFPVKAIRSGPFMARHYSSSHPLMSPGFTASAVGWKTHPLPLWPSKPTTRSLPPQRVLSSTLWSASEILQLHTSGFPAVLLTPRVRLVPLWKGGGKAIGTTDQDSTEEL